MVLLMKRHTERQRERETERKRERERERGRERERERERERGREKERETGGLDTSPPSLLVDGSVVIFIFSRGFKPRETRKSILNRRI